MVPVSRSLLADKSTQEGVAIQDQEQATRNIAMKSANRAYEGGIRVNGRPVKEVHHRGHTYIEGRKGTEYTLHFQNHSNRRVLAIPSVDGLCVVNGKPAGRNSPGFIVEPYESIDIPGWMVDRATAAKFTFWPQDARGEGTYVEELSKSGARVDTGNQGLIGFLVLEEHFTPTLRLTGHHSDRDHRVWNSAGFDTGYDPALRGIAISSSGAVPQNMGISASSSANMGPGIGDYMQKQIDDLGSERGVGTKFGDATPFDTTAGEFKRGAIVGEIIIEYDTLRGLKDRGVPVNLFKGVNKGYGTRSAFPADGGCTPPVGWKG